MPDGANPFSFAAFCTPRLFKYIITNISFLAIVSKSHKLALILRPTKKNSDMFYTFMWLMNLRGVKVGEL